MFIPDANHKISGTYKVKQIESRNAYNYDEIDITYMDLLFGSTSLGRVNDPSVNREYEFELDTSELAENSTLKLGLLFDIYSRVTYPQPGQPSLVASNVYGETNTATVSYTN